MATRKQREHQWAATTVLPERHRPLWGHTSTTGYCCQEAKHQTARDTGLEDPSVYSGHQCFADPLSPPHPCLRNTLLPMCPKGHQRAVSVLGAKLMNKYPFGSRSDSHPRNIFARIKERRASDGGYK